MSAYIAPASLDDVVFMNSQFSITVFPPDLIRIAPSVLFAVKLINLAFLILVSDEKLIYNAGPYEAIKLSNVTLSRLSFDVTI